jgi:uncharacterized protein YkwD
MAMVCALALVPAASQLADPVSAEARPPAGALAATGKPGTAKLPGHPELPADELPLPLGTGTPESDDGGTAAAITPPPPFTRKSPAMQPAAPEEAPVPAPVPAPAPAAAGPAAPADAPPADQPPTHDPASPAPPTQNPLLPPEPPSIPPLVATPEELAGASRAPSASALPAPDMLAREGLLQESNAAQVSAVFNAINSYRASLGLAPVRYHATVAGMAQEWSNSLASREVIEHRANFWTDPRALYPTQGAGEVIAVRWDRDAAQLVEWWKNSPAHNAVLKDPRFNVVGIGITFTDGNWQTTPGRYTMWGVVDFFGYTSLPAGTTTGSTEFPAPSPTMCDPQGRHMPPTVDLAAAAIKSAGDLLSVDAAGQLINRPLAGSRAFGAPQAVGSGFGGTKDLFITDWERDGVFDVLAQWNDGRLTLHSGQAAGGFLPPLTLGQSGWAGMTLAVGGWCANNRMPQLLALDSSGNLWLYPNRGSADLAARTQIASGVSATRLAMVDYDADGFQDLLARRSDGNVLLYRGAGSPVPRAEARSTVASGWSDVVAMRPLKDVTGQNSTGLAAQRSGGTVQYWDLPGGSLQSPSSVPGNWTGTRLAQ